MSINWEILCNLLHLSLEIPEVNVSFFEKNKIPNWEEIHELAKKQGVLGLTYDSLEKLPQKQRPPLPLYLLWASEAETIRGHNLLLNNESARLTKIFSEKGAFSAVLKGPANARHYKNPMARQAGDIDLFVEGGYQHVCNLLHELDLFPLEPQKNLTELQQAKRKLATSYHHIHLPQNENGVSVEIHFRPSSGNYNPYTNARLQKFLEREIKIYTCTPEGFNEPSFKFALIMQLSHIQRHFIAEGIGLRQIIDYYVLLKKTTINERLEIVQIIPSLGLSKTCGALMWLLTNLFQLEKEFLISKLDSRRGRWLLQNIQEGGNFGKYIIPQKKSPYTLWLKRRCYFLKKLPFDYKEALWKEITYWKTFLKSIPIRIRLRKLSIRDLF